MMAAVMPSSKGSHEHQTAKATASGWIGSALEYYDFFIYATAASLVFPQLFFPSGDPAVAIAASLATYGVGYIARPVGAFFLGHWGDTHGRKNVLLLCMFLMGFSTMAVGLLPTYQQVGWFAPAVLVTLRLIQGFAVAGEISGASSMIVEHAPFGRRGWYASFTLQGVQAGQIFAAAIFLPLARYLSDDAFNSTDNAGTNEVLPGNGGTLTLTFKHPGTFVYFCRFHAHLDELNQPVAPGPDGGIQDSNGNFGTPMSGVITVQRGNAG